MNENAKHGSFRQIFMYFMLLFLFYFLFFTVNEEG